MRFVKTDDGSYLNSERIIRLFTDNDVVGDRNEVKALTVDNHVFIVSKHSSEIAAEAYLDEIIRLLEAGRGA